VKEIEGDWGKFHIGKLKYLPFLPSTNVIIMSWEMGRTCCMPGRDENDIRQFKRKPWRKGRTRKTQNYVLFVL